MAKWIMGHNRLAGSLLAFPSKLVAIDVICKKCIERKVSQETFKSFPLLVVEMLEAKSKMKPSLLLTNTTLPAALTRNQRLNFVHENIPNIDLVGLRPIQDSEVRKFHQSCCKTTVGTFANFYSNSTQTPFMHLQWFAKENQQSPVYVVNCQFSRSPDRY